MKKISKFFVLLIVLPILLSSIVAFAIELPQEDDVSQSLEDILIGTWRWETSHSWTVVFRADGTGVDGSPGLRSEFVWHVDNDRLFFNGTDVNLRVHNDIIIFERFSGTSYTYFRYSDNTDATASPVWPFLLLGLFILLLPIVVIIFIVSRVRRKRRQNDPAYAPQANTFQFIIGKPPIILDIFVLIFNIFVDISLLLNGRFLFFFVFFIFTILPATRVIRALTSKIIVNESGVSGKIKKENFHWRYHEISSASLQNHDSGKGVLLVSGYNSHSIRLKNARAVRDAIAHNMAIANVTPAPLPTPPPPQASSPINPPPTAQDVLYTHDTPPIPLTEFLRQRISDICRRESIGAISKFHMFEEIPLKLLENAITAYAPSLDPSETALFLYDDSIAGSGKSGFLLTNKALYTKSDFEKPAKAYLQNISRVTDMGKYKIRVEMDTGNYIAITISLKETLSIQRTLDETIQLLRHEQTSHGR